MSTEAAKCDGCGEVKPDVRMRDGTGEPEQPACDECMADWRNNQREDVPR